MAGPGRQEPRLLSTFVRRYRQLQHEEHPPRTRGESFLLGEPVPLLSVERRKSPQHKMGAFYTFPFVHQIRNFRYRPFRRSLQELQQHAK